jgi:hypothetical protein
MAMSIASYIALAARTVDPNAKITVMENSVLAIHNPYSYVRGDWRVMKKTSDYLEKITAVYASAHIAVSGKTEKEIRDAMDNETMYVGEEIMTAGFANDFDSSTEPAEVMTGESPAARHDNLIITAKFAMNRTMERAQEAEAKTAPAFYDGLKKAAALFACNAPKPPAASSVRPGENITVALGGFMKPEELLAQNKELYDAVFALGEKAGLDRERARVNAHLMLGEKSGSLEIAAKHIKAGVSVNDETASAEYFAAHMDKTRIEARNADDPGDIHTGGEAGAVGGADDEKLSAAFANGLAGRDAGGKPWAV